ncbi:capsular biosynthesis protein [Campylobacter lari]|uniref:capsule polysaccharide modification protein KpsS n=1 Tax=Campylobacter lari TaxID=201 RepID=UPI00126F331E|nr:capsular biosynthesis protein [Campylobacter lari]EAJ6452976.1 capsular biosynthesis protein [Campylobacter lari]EAK0771436.1 capsular biosynthesis protein [Campylobacter lari]EAK6012308.1 capsular biosynthesis protein [Campylobacter lari]EAK9997714.1 capsular biosynthesis protein [Campylobacter lari]EDP6860075.1 capsule biosynthesis protein [Campylobacter lari]
MNLSKKLKKFSGKNVLLLQGPVGGFFRKIATKIPKAKVYKVNFNGGDFFFYPFKSINYTKSLAELEDFYKKLFEEKQIQVVIMYNDCRKVHEIAINVAKQMGIEVWIFEEGYIRPNFITFEKDGVNANSTLPREKEFYLSQKKFDKDFKFKTFSSTFKNMAFSSFLYWLFAFLLSWCFNNSLHHRSLKLFDFLPWFCSVYRKNKYKISEKKLNEKILSLKQKYFLAILQVHNDTQLSHHYKKTTEKFIEEVIISFANHAKAKSYLVFKHHPMDRGYRDYTKLIEDLSLKYNVEGRILYVHDLHLPTLLINARGTIVINSTVGLSALYHNSPLKVMGKAFYDIEGLTYQKSLHTFWKECRAYKPDAVLHAKFRNYVIYKTQVNGNFFKNTSLD